MSDTGMDAPEGTIDLESYFLDRDFFVVPEDALRDITKGPLRDFILQCRDIQQLQQVWNCLLHTFSAANLPGSHNTAICNAISGYLESALKSDNEELRQFVLSETTWMSVFENYLDRYQNGRPKPMKQVLTTLIMIVSKYMDASTSRLVYQQIARITIPVIVLFEPRSRLKACLVALEALMRKDAVDVAELCRLTENWLWDNRPSWIPLLGEHCVNLEIPLNKLAHQTERNELSLEDLRLYAMQIFCLVLLLNMNNRDISLPAGMLFFQLCCRLKSVTSVYEFQYYTNGTPFWAAPLKYVSLMNLNDLDPIANHALFPLFQTEPKDFLSFVTSLPLDSLQSKSYTRASNEEYTLLFAILELGKTLGLVHNKEALPNLSPRVAESSVILQTEDYQQFLVHINENIRIPALSLLITDPATTRPLSPTALQILMDTLPYMHADTDPHSRSQLLGLLRRLVIRLRGSSNTTQAAVDNRLEGKSDQPMQKDTVPDAQSFLHWYINFLESDLQPTAPYQKHILALKVLLLLLQSGVDSRIDPVHLSKMGQDQQTWRFNTEVFKPKLFRAIADLLIDPFDDVRETSLMLLRLFPHDFLQIHSDASHPTPYSQLLEALSRAETLAADTSRADHSDSVGRLYHLLFDLAPAADDNEQQTGANQSKTKHGIVDDLLMHLERSISCSPQAFYSILHNTPLQGQVMALRYIAETPNFHVIASSSQDPVPSWSSFLERMLSVAWSIWFGVHDTLCVDSPEREHEDIGDELAGPKDVLSFSWRALRESSLLLNAILLNPTFAPSGSQDGIGYRMLLRIGSLSFEQLTELRHRGAFSTVSQTFASCCQRCVQSDDAAAQDLPAGWYKETVGIIYDQGSQLTRRSAGLPAIITGIASSQPKSDLFRQIMEKLQDIARTSPMDAAENADLELPQVHALNCLKDLFTNTILSLSTEPHIMSALDISANCLGSKIWAIRNCGLMLFRALINRMSCPTPESRRGVFTMPGSESNHTVPFEKYRGLVPLLSKLLDTPLSEAQSRELEASGESDLSILTERVFPALELIGNKAPSLPSSEDEILRRLALSHLSSPVWGIRDHSARTYVSLVKRTELLQTAQEFLVSGTQPQTPNEVHGRLLCMKYLLQKLWELPCGYWRRAYDLLLCAEHKLNDLDNLEDAMATIEKLFKDHFSLQLAPHTQACFFEILGDALQASVVCGKEDAILPLCETKSQKSLFETLLGRLLTSTSGSSAARSSSVLIRFFAFDIISLKLLKKSAPEDLAQLVEGISVVDLDAAPWLLHRLHQVFGSYTGVRFDTIRLYICIIEITQSQQLKTAAMSNLAKSLEDVYEKGAQFPSELEFLKDWAKSIDLFTEESGSQLSNREMVNTSMHLEGCLLPLRVESAEGLVNSAAMKINMRRLVQMMSSAMAEETEFSTRYSVVSSMKCFILGLQIRGIYSRDSSCLVEVYFILYDILNDDAEEIRDAGAHIASKILLAEFLTPKLPLASTVALAGFFAQFFPTSQGVFEGALFRFMGGHRNKCPFTSVSELFAELHKGSTVLFVEEKQNLYIDEVREIEIWSSVLARLDYHNCTADLRRKFFSWVSNGLATFCEEVRKDQAMGILGWMSVSDAFAVTMRLIYGAKVLLVTEGLGCPDSNLSTLQVALQELKGIGDSAGTYEPWISGVNSALDPKDASDTSVLQASFDLC
ncbi:hypothetical protein PRK78_002467 [Emydomyces testavorans]|uniref:DUF2428 domain-containing protein n=1 Tax=Emydomyces testavorans TaxID=2070801 RepID=A0AAF0DEW8_9EURO|nr:hypothetical protein PRK78_002467 [Emydomyces testavorans]